MPHGFGGHGAHTRRRYHADSAGPGPLIYYPAPNVKRRVEQLSEEEQVFVHYFYFFDEICLYFLISNKCFVMFMFEDSYCKASRHHPTAPNL